MRVAINGFGRIGRLTLRHLLKNKQVEIVAVNDLSDAHTLAHLFKYDSSQGSFAGAVSGGGSILKIEDREIQVFSERDPAQLPWKDLKVDVVVECTGLFRDEAGAGKHITAGAGKVVISAPAKGNIKTVVYGLNHRDITPEDLIISNASCTSNCLAPVAYLLQQKYGIEFGYINTIHSYTGDQNLQDGPHSDLRRARAAALNIVPTTTGATNTVSKVIPALKGKLGGMATRVPTITGSLTDFTTLLEKEATVDEINQLMKNAAENEFKGILEYTEDPIVSTDIIGNPHSSIFDGLMTKADRLMIKVVAWYDNEMGYATRTADLVVYMAGQ